MASPTMLAFITPSSDPKALPFTKRYSLRNRSEPRLTSPQRKRGNSTMNEAQPPVQPRPWRLQFSLKLLLIAFTAFAIGFPIWYRWPYEATDVDSTGTTRWVTTWQRQWGGGRLKHGLERVISGGQIVQSTMYHNGLRHGPYLSP